MSGEKGARVLPFRPRTETETPRLAEAPRPPGPAPRPQRTGADVAPLRRRRESSPFLRHRGGRIRHSRQPPILRLVRPFVTALAIVGGPVLLVLWIFRSPVFAVETVDVEIEGGGRVSDTWVRETLEPVRGWNLPRLPLAWVDRRLKSHPWIEAAALTKNLPNRLAVRVVERREVALRRGRAEKGETALWYLDENGKTIAPWGPADGEVDLPLVSAPRTGDLRPALALVGEIEETAPAWAGGLSEIEVLGDEDFRVWSVDLPFPILVRSGTLAAKTSYLEDLLPEITRRYEDVQAVDLRFTRKIILQPSVRAAGRSVPGVYQRGLGG